MIETNQPHLEVRALSHPGLSGKQNEDRYKVCSSQVSNKDRTPTTLAVLCDGIGGHRAGEVAAEIGVSIITEAIMAGDPKKSLEVIEKAVASASDAIQQASLSDQMRLGMGATCAIAWVIGNRLYTANLGDSRIYLLRDGNIAQLTTDHTWVQEAVEAGLIDEAERTTHPNAHVIRRYLGAKDNPEPDFRMWYFEGESDSEALQNQGMRLKSGDILLLCSDGLTDLVEDHEIQDVIAKNPLDTAMDELIQISIERGGHDNTTGILMEAPSTGVFKNPKKRSVILGCLLSLIIASVMVAVIYFAWQWWENRVAGGGIQSPRITTPSPSRDDNLLPSETNFPTFSQTNTGDIPTDVVTQQPSITPWPTNTTEP